MGDEGAVTAATTPILAQLRLNQIIDPGHFVYEKSLTWDLVPYAHSMGIPILIPMHFDTIDVETKILGVYPDGE